ncbi:uncharacterized protein LOC116164406 [Photinus pyralis]|uniref:uncharacterized protein LOC116158941 n=1 Tax=Photinus pyralis TaxID=7054 RepID=UPI0012676C7B|nr:uncharacterized protein LOC116158941 [Photinus pyralis]XP_031327677.1 uncharacterized protein LOC116158941 [Photinus pyralis]XP_031334443.1 uncharacterized protein LOC116164406 [Photinus pyralis]XP_031334444.1 uncharacterized protein LOC116164406 [Photinus pyralis]
MPRSKKARNVNEPERPEEPRQEANALMVPPPPIPPPEALIPPQGAMEVPAAAENPRSNTISPDGVPPARSHVGAPILAVGNDPAERIELLERYVVTTNERLRAFEEELGLSGP